jgi:large subunit ribosomal protein L3
MEGILGRKIGMTQVFDQMGHRIPVTVIEAGPCRVMAKAKTKSGDRGTNVQIAFDECSQKALNRPKVGYFEGKGVKPHRVLREFTVPDDVAAELEEGTELTLTDLFGEGDSVDVSGTSKGRGFTGVIKRHGYHGTKATHGTHEAFRHGGSNGPSADPARTFKGKKMPGQHGNTTVTVQNLEVVQIFADKNLILLKGAVPGPRSGLVEIRKAVKKNARLAERL